MAVDSEMVKRKLNDLRVVDLRAELENRGIDKSGVKAVLIERLQQALLKEGHDPEDYFFEVVETPLKKNTKRTNKKFTRDDESETHSNVDETPIDLGEDEGKFDSDDEVIDEKFFQVLETTDIAEDPMAFAIEEDEGKFLIDEEEVGTGAKDDEKAQDDNDHRAKNGDGTADSHQNSSAEKVNGMMAEGENASELDASAIKLEDDSALIVTVDETQNLLESELASPTGQHGSTPLNKEGDNGGTFKAAASGKDTEDSETKDASLSPSLKGGEDSSSKSKTTLASVVEKGSSDVSAGDDKQEDDKPPQSASKTKSSALGSTTTIPSKDAKTPDLPKQARIVGSGKNLWVTGLSSTTRATDLKALFSKHGKVVGAKIVSNARSSGSRCYGFVTMATIEDAAKCIQHLHRTELHGRLISVEKAKAEPVSSNRKIIGKPVAPAKKTPEKKEGTSVEVKEEASAEKKLVEGAGTKEKEVERKDVSDKGEKEKTEETEEGKSGSKEGSKDRDSERRKRSHRSGSRKSSKERTVHRGGFNRPFVFRDRRPFRRPILHRPFGLRPRNPLTFRRITDERMRQRSRDYERKNREEERRRHQDMVRQREIERKQREESVRLERERERLRIEREKLERERAEVLRLEREKQRMERERIEREREELRKNRERLSGNRFEDPRRPIKRAFDAHANDHIDDRKRPNVGGTRFVSTGAFHNDRRPDTFERKADHFNDNIRRDLSRRDPPVHDHDDRRPVRTDRFERGPTSRDTDLRGHGRDDRGASYRDGDSSAVHRPGSKDDWKQPPDRRSGVTSNSDAYVSSGGRQGESRYVERSSDSWQGHSGSQSDHRGGEGKTYSSGSGIGSGPRDQWGGESRKIDSGHTQSWGRSDNVQGSRWGGMNARGQQSMGIGQSMIAQNSLYGGPPSTVGQSSTMGMGSSASSSFNSDRFDTYKGPNSMRRY